MQKTVCLNSATASVSQYAGSELVMVYSQKSSMVMGYNKLSEAIKEKATEFCSVDLDSVTQSLRKTERKPFKS